MYILHEVAVNKIKALGRSLALLRPCMLYHWLKPVLRIA